MPWPPRSPTLHAAGGMVCSVDHVASARGRRHAASRRVGRRRRHRHQRGARRHHASTCAAWAATCSRSCTARTAPPDALCAAGRAGTRQRRRRACAPRATGPCRFRGDVRSAPVPGCVDGWCALHERHGRLPLADGARAGAARYAADGFAASPLLALATALVADVAGADDFLPAGRPGRPARAVRRPARRAAPCAPSRHGGRAAFYEGAFGDALLDARRRRCTTRDDLARSQADWVDADRARGVGPSHLDRPAAVAGLPGA